MVLALLRPCRLHFPGHRLSHLQYRCAAPVPVLFQPGSRVLPQVRYRSPERSLETVSRLPVLQAVLIAVPLQERLPVLTRWPGWRVWPRLLCGYQEPLFVAVAYQFPLRVVRQVC